MGVADRSRAGGMTPAMSAGKLLFELQVEQHHHDEMYHREIARLPMHQRLNHMALHFAKYTGKVAATKDAATIVPIYVDTLIIALSTANILNADLWELVEPEGREFLGLSAFGRDIANKMDGEIENSAVLLQETAIASGRMAAACEKIDHLEEVSFRTEIKFAVSRLSRLSIAFLVSQGIDPIDAIHERLSVVKRRLRLHGRI